MKKILLSLCLLCCASYQTPAFFSVSDGSGFLELPWQISHDSLGFAANLHGISAMAINPAQTVSQIQQGARPTQFQLTYQPFLDNMAYYSLMANHFWGKKIGLTGLSLAYLDYGSFENNDALGVAQGMINASEFSLGLSYAMELKKDLSVGANLKYFRWQVAHFQNQNVVVDLGAHQKFFWKQHHFQASLAVQNAGLPSKVIDVATPLPTVLLASVSYPLNQLWTHSSLKALEAVIAPQVLYSLSQDYAVGASLALNYHIGPAKFYLNSMVQFGSAESVWSIGFGVSAKFNNNEVHFTSLMNQNVMSEIPAVSVLYSLYQYEKNTSIYNERIPKRTWSQITKDEALRQNIVSVVVDNGEVFEGIIEKIDDDKIRIKIIGAKLRKDNIVSMNDFQERNEKGEIKQADVQEMVVTLKDGSQLKGVVEQIDGKYFLRGNVFFGNDFEIAMEQVDKIAQIKKVVVVTKDKKRFVGNLSETSENFIAIDNIYEPKENQQIEREDIHSVITGTSRLNEVDSPDKKYLAE